MNPDDQFPLTPTLSPRRGESQREIKGAADLENRQDRLGLGRVVQTESAFADFRCGFTFELQRLTLAQRAGISREILKTSGVRHRSGDQAENAVAAGGGLFHQLDR